MTDKSMEKAGEHPAENIEYLKTAGKLSYTLLTPINPRSICWLWIEVTTPLDDHQTCSVRIEIDFIDDYMAGSDGEEFPIEMGNFGFKELKAFKAFPVLLDIFSSVHGSICSVADFCKKLEAAGIKGNYDPETCYYYTEHEKFWT